MAFKHYDVVRASSPSDLAGKLTQKLKEGWQPYGSPIISNAGYGAEFIQAIMVPVDERMRRAGQHPIVKPTLVHGRVAELFPTVWQQPFFCMWAEWQILFPGK